MGEIALCRPLHDPKGAIAELKALTSPFPEPLREALLRRFQWEILFSLENAETAIARGEQSHIAGCVYRALACLAQVSLNERYLINEKGALQEAETFPLTIPNLMNDVGNIWQLIGERQFAAALARLRNIDEELKALTGPSGPARSFRQ